MSKVRLSLNIVNTSSDELVVHIEPWGVQNAVQSGGNYEFDVEGPNDETLELEYGEKRITVYGWPDSSTSARTEQPIKSKH